MKSDKLEQTVKHYLINNLLKIDKLKENNKYINPELRLWKNKKITLSSSSINTLPYSKEEELKQKDALFFIEANQYDEINEAKVEKDVQIFKIKKSSQGIHKTPICDIECKMVHYLDHAEGKLSTKLFEKITNYKFQELNLPKLDFAKQLAFFINPNTQQKCNYYVFCFSDTLSTRTIKILNPNRELDPTKASYVTNEDFNKYKTLCPEITFQDVLNLYTKNKNNNNFFTIEERQKIKKILSTGKEYFEKVFKEEFPFTSTNKKQLCLFPQQKTHRMANGYYRNPETEKFEGGRATVNYPFISDIYKNYLKPIVLDYCYKNQDRLITEAKQLTEIENKRIKEQDIELGQIFDKNKSNVK